MADYTELDVTYFVREVWAPEIMDILAASKGLKKSLNYQAGPVGAGTLTIPLMSALTAGKKSSGFNVSWNAGGDSEIQVVLDTQGYCGFILQDFDQIRSGYDVRSAKAKSQLESINYQEDGDIITALGALSYATGHTVTAAEVLPGSDTDETAAAKVDMAIRRCHTILNVKNVPESNRFVLMNPYVADALYGSTKFTSEEFVGEKPLVNGLLGPRYGMNWIHHSGVSIAYSGTTKKTTSTVYVYHSDALCFGEWQGVQMEAQRDIDAIADKVLMHNMYGMKAGRQVAATKVSLSWDGNPFGL